MHSKSLITGKVLNSKKQFTPTKSVLKTYRVYQKMLTIQQVYQQVPNVKCKGKCQEACGLIACSAAEAENMANNGIIPPQTRTHPTLGTNLHTPHQ